MPRIPVWGWIAIAVGAFLLLRPRVALGQGVRPSGSLGQVDMGTHGVSKSVGGSVTGNIAFTGLTKNSAGTGIRWNYRIRLVVATTGAIPFQFQVDGSIVSGGFNTLTFSTIVFTMPNAPAGLYSVTAFLQAEGSNAVGTPTGIYSDIPGAQATHSNAINLVITGAAVPAGSIGSVDVAQVRAAQMFLQ